MSPLRYENPHGTEGIIASLNALTKLSDWSVAK